ncbi:MAG: ABC1 kinase family protein [Myxococcota bacterium]
MRRPPGSARRLREVVEAFMVEGLQVPLARMRVTSCASLACRVHCTWARWTGRRPTGMSWQVAVRDALVRLGPAFVKVGQILSVRADLVPRELASALRTLQSDVPPVPLDAVRPVIEAALKKPLDVSFRRFEERPLAAGSLAQVHVAELADGRRVAVKVKRPGTDARVREDLTILRWLAEELERRVPESHPYRPVAAAAELERYTLRELDFRNEARVSRDLRDAHAGDARVRIPEVHLATADVLVMEFVESFPLDDVAAIAEHGLDRRTLVRAGLDVVLAELFEFGLFHGDPHPGNLHVTPTGKIVLLDFGIHGRLDERVQRDCALLVWMLSRGDTDLASFYLLRLARLTDDADVDGFRRAIEARYAAWRGTTLAEYGFARLLYEELTLGASHGVILPSELLLLAKALVTVEGVARALEPDLDVAREVRPYLERVHARFFSVERLRDGLVRALPLWWDVAERLPAEVAERLDRSLTMRGERAAPSAPPLAPALVAAAMILAGAGLLAAAGDPEPHHRAIVGALALLAGLVAGLRAVAR